MNLEKYKSVLNVIVINFAFSILLFISANFPYMEGYNTVIGWSMLFSGGIEGLVIILIATGCIFYYKIRFAIFFHIIGCSLLAINLGYVVYTTLRLSWYSLSFGNIFLAIALCGFVVNIIPLVKKRNLEKEVAEEKFQVMLKRTTGGENLKNRLFGMIKIEKQINLNTVRDMLKIPEDEIRALIYELVGEGKLEGEFQEESFLISSDIDEFLAALDSSFQGWEETVQAKEKKI